MWKGKCESFKRRLAAVLAVRGMGQREFATFCKVTPRAVRNWLSGRPPSPTVFALISSAWGEDTFLYLIGDINRMPEPDFESSHRWVNIDDGQTIKLCACGLRQCDDGSFQDSLGHFFNTAPMCGMRNGLPNPRMVEEV